jgi:hypothetical protein
MYVLLLLLLFNFLKVINWKKKKDINRMRLHSWYFAYTVGGLNLGGKEPLGTILESDPVIEAFKFMNIKVDIDERERGGEERERAGE